MTSAGAGTQAGRHLGFAGATLVGVGAIVGGGVLALAGVAFSSAGPSALIAFGLNGVIALLTALSFAEMSARFPESGGTYTFAKKVLSVEAAFMVGWVVWFASIVAAVLYALGFARFFQAMAAALWSSFLGTPPAWLSGAPLASALAIAATGLYALGLVRRNAGGGEWATIGKVVVFAVIILAGLWGLARAPLTDVRAHLSPFFAGGAMGLVTAMGYTFIALQGFDLIAAVAGEVKDPGKNLPRSMLWSLGIALLVYVPLLFVVMTVGVAPGVSIGEASAAGPETIIADAAQRFMGPTGWWLVIVAALLSMLSALQANLYGASRVALAMARDRTLPERLSRFSERAGTPSAAVLVTAGAVALILLFVQDLATAGAASSLIFLLSFAIVHWTHVLRRRRPGDLRSPYESPWFPTVQIVGAASCLGLALFQGLAVSSAGALVGAWLAAGTGLYLTLLAPRARVVDAAAQARDPDLLRLRGRAPLVLVPIANPASAEALVGVASALVAPRVGRVLLLSVVRPPGEWTAEEAPRQLQDAQSIIGEALTASFAAHLAPEALVTVGSEPWKEIARVARAHHCECLLVGFGGNEAALIEPVEQLMNRVESDVVILRAPPQFSLAAVRQVLVPTGGASDQGGLRARLLGSLLRTGEREISFLRILPLDATPMDVARAKRTLQQVALDEAPNSSRILVETAADPVALTATHAEASDLVVLGLGRRSRHRKRFGEFPLQVLAGTTKPVLLIGQKG